jgi:hypothetical protein
MKNINYIVGIFALLTLVSCIPQEYKPTKTPIELQAIQSKEFPTTKKIAFAATLSVFQDLGYIVESASFETGLITAKSPTKQDFDLFDGQVMTFVKATAFVEEVNVGRTKVRTNIVNSRNTSSGYGMKGEHDLPVESADTYQDLFNKIQQAIFVRKNT